MKTTKGITLHPGIILKEEVIDANNLSIGATAELLGIIQRPSLPSIPSSRKCGK